MKKGKLIAVLALCFCVLLCATGCAALLEKLEDAELRGYTEEMLEAIMAGDEEAAYALVDDVYLPSQFETWFKIMSDELFGVESYELQLISINTYANVNNGEPASWVTASYVLTCETGKYVVGAYRNSEYERLADFSVTDYASTSLYYTGTLDSMREAGVVQWLVLVLLNLALLAVTVYAIVDCIRIKTRKKVLWILLIILVSAVINLNLAGGPGFSFNLGTIMSYSALIRYGDGTVQLRVLLPLGAIIYFCIRKKLLPKPEPVSAQQIALAEERPENEE